MAVGGARVLVDVGVPVGVGERVGGTGVSVSVGVWVGASDICATAWLAAACRPGYPTQPTKARAQPGTKPITNKPTTVTQSFVVIFPQCKVQARNYNLISSTRFPLKT